MKISINIYVNIKFKTPLTQKNSAPANAGADFFLDI